jgi:hypothetical protein
MFTAGAKRRSIDWTISKLIAMVAFKNKVDFSALTLPESMRRDSGAKVHKMSSSCDVHKGRRKSGRTVISR